MFKSLKSDNGTPSLLISNGRLSVPKLDIGSINGPEPSIFHSWNNSFLIVANIKAVVHSTST